MIHTARQSMKFKQFVRVLRGIVESPTIDHETLAVGLLERLWHATSTGAPRGDIGKYPDDLIAEECGWYGDSQTLISLLVDAGYLDQDPEARLIVHDWHDHAPNWVKGLAKRSGGFFTSSSPEDSPREAENRPEKPLSGVVLLGLVEWIEGRGGRCTARELQRGGAPHFREPGAAQLALDKLAELGRGKWQEGEFIVPNHATPHATPCDKSCDKSCDTRATVSQPKVGHSG